MSQQDNDQKSPFVTKEDNPDPEYQKLMAAYSDNPFHDITKVAIEEYVKKAEDKETQKPDEPAVV